MDEIEDLDGLEIEGVVELSEVYAKNSRYKPFLDKVLKGLKENAGKGLKLRIRAPDLKALKNKLKTLRSQCDYLGGEYAKIGFIRADSQPIKDAAGNNQFRVNAVLNEKVVNVKTKGKSGKKNKRQASNASKPAEETVAVKPAPPDGGQYGQWQAVSLGEMKKQMLETVNNMPPQVLPMFLAQQQALLAVKQSELAAEGIKEADAAKLKGEIQATQEVIEAIKKKMGQ